MRQRFILTLGFVLIMSTFASSNQCFRQCRKSAVKPAASINGEYSTLLVGKLLYI